MVRFHFRVRPKVVARARAVARAKGMVKTRPTVAVDARVLAQL